MSSVTLANNSTVSHCVVCSGVARGHGCVSPVVAGNFSKFNRTLKITRFVTIYGYVQSNIQHVSPASAWGLRGFAPRLRRESVPGPRWGRPSLDPLFFPLGKFRATPLVVWQEIRK